jgi:hypothetical protein
MKCHKEPKYVIIANGGRCGSTLLTQLMQLKGRTVAFSEPDIFSTISAQIDRNVWSEQLQAKLIEGAFRVFCKNVKGSFV